MDRAAAPAAKPFLPAQDLGEKPAQIDTFGEGVAVTAVGRGHSIGRL